WTARNAAATIWSRTKENHRRSILNEHRYRVARVRRVFRQNRGASETECADTHRAPPLQASQNRDDRLISLVAMADDSRLEDHPIGSAFRYNGEQNLTVLGIETK